MKKTQVLTLFIPERKNEIELQYSVQYPSRFLFCSKLKSNFYRELSTVVYGLFSMYQSTSFCIANISLSEAKISG